MFRFEKYIILFVLLVLTLPMRQVYATVAEPVSDVRILIDVSGSMKKNDPNNLRSPALRLIVGLLPEKSQSGVWTFGKYVNMLVPLREVNDAWKLEAERRSKEVHSYGLFTNIEHALNKATANQKGDNPKYRRSVILLSDGLVDVSTNAETNAKSRQRILDIIVPRLKKANVAVHTIALSDTADHALLRSISLATDGWYEQVDSAEKLQRVFLHLFEKAAKRDTVPLLDNNFKIDDSVSEMTLLIFRRDGAKDTLLLTPEQAQITNKERPNNVRWHSEDNYDLITIDNPTTGTWQIDADVDPDNRVMVVTDLKLKTTDLPNNILLGETFDFDASLTEKSEIIVRQDFLTLVDVELKEESEIADEVFTNLNKAQRKGIYRAHIGETFQPGRNDVVVTFKSATFERQRRQSINVVETPFDINVEQLEGKETRTHRLTLKPDSDLINAEKLNIAAMLTSEDGSEWSYDVMQSAELEWQLTLAELEDGKQYSVALQIRGETAKGRSLFLQPEVIVLEDELFVPEPEVIEDIEPVVAEPEEESTDDEFSSEVIVDEMAGDDVLLTAIDDDLNVIDDSQLTDEGLSPAIKLAIGNGVILFLVVMIIFFWRRKSSARKNPGDQL
ncbi:MAG: VWA domain-containing protein [Methylophaga sp.]|nr:VWA domain-containing protein [Methylophaga sp.]